jgi:hypothetical protein
MTRLRGDKTTWPRGPAGSWGDIEIICCGCGYSEEWGKGPRTRRPGRLLRCALCRSRAVRLEWLEWQPPGRGPKNKPIVIYSHNPDGAAKEVAGAPAAHGITKFVWSLMGQDAGQPLNEIIIRKEAERRTGQTFWWGLGTGLGARVESAAISNGGTLPALFSALGNQKQAPNQKTYVWNGWRSVRKGRYRTYSHGSIPEHALVLGGNPDRAYYGLVCRCDTELVLGDHGPFDPTQCLTVAKGVPPGRSQRAALLTGQVKHPHGRYTIAFIAGLVEPWFVRLTHPRELTAAKLARVRQYKPGDDWLALIKSLRD